MSVRARISVIVPVRNGGEMLKQCLSALLRECGPDDEIVVVDDGSTDETPDIAGRAGARLLKLEESLGPAAARNHGANHAQGELFFFVDADVVLGEGAIERVARTFAKRPEISAIFGSYDSAPAANGIVSQYRNLLHHYTHQTGNPEASTFWSGCGAVRRDAFEAVGGFDASRYAKPSIEDIELGIRLRRAGHRILLDRALLAKHLKRWTLASVIRTDVRCRAIPWSQLILENGAAPNDLNLKLDQRFCGLFALLGVACLPLAVLRPDMALISLAAFVTVLVVNRSLFLFFVRRRGLAFTTAAAALHMLYYVYSSLSYAYVRAGWVGSQRRQSAPVSAE